MTIASIRDVLQSILGKDLGLSNKGMLVGTNLNSLAFRNQKYPVFEDVLGKSGFFTDFLGKTISGALETKSGSDGGVTAMANNGGVNGEAFMTTGAGATTTMAVNGAQFHTALNYRSSNGLLFAETKIKVDVVTNLAFFFGFTDQVSALEMPFTLSAGTLTSNATDAAGFLFDTAATAATIKLVGVKGDTDATVQNTGVALVAGTYITLRVEIDENENASFYINGVLVGTLMASALTKTVALTPVVAAFSRTAASHVVTSDYFGAGQNRTAGVV